MHGSVKILLEGEANSGVRLRVKIEINTDEVPPALALTRIAHSVDTRWWSGEAEIPTFQPGELVGQSSVPLRNDEKGATCGTCGSPAGSSISPIPTWPLRVTTI